MSRLPTPGADSNNWGTLLNDYLQQAHNADGTLVTTATNSYTSTTNMNLATTSQAGLVKLVTDLGGTALLPNVTGLQGRPVSSATPAAGDVLTWDNTNSIWKPIAAPGAGTGMTHAQTMARVSLGL
ncbi:MAG: hypothetical protein JWN38_254 [Candidatus Saccharibacteria bacterium]|nr:hypothetical protein [Candidatus Saccharibacteria bacterium]